MLILILSLAIKVALEAEEVSKAPKTGVFPACKTKVSGYYGGPNSSLTVIGVPSSIAERDGIIIGKIDIEYSVYYPGAAPEDAARAYAAGVAIGLDPSDMADSAARAMDSSSSVYKRRIKFAYEPNSKSCYLDGKVIDTETGKTVKLSEL
jgi:hypothetical protein